MPESCTLDEILQRVPNLILGMANCSDCEKAMLIFARKHQCFGYCPKETHQNVVEEVKNKYKHTSFPAVFINGQFIGDEKALEEHFK